MAGTVGLFRRSLAPGGLMLIGEPYAAAQWLNVRRWLDANPGDELAGEMRAELTAEPARHARSRREYLGWGVFALMDPLIVSDMERWPRSRPRWAGSSARRTGGACSTRCC